MVNLVPYRLNRTLLQRSGPLARTLRFPDPRSAPWRRPNLDLHRQKGIGDVLMCTPALRELKRRNPTCHVRFYTRCETLIRGLPYIDEVLPFDDRPADAIELLYENLVPPRTHIARIFADVIGLKITDLRPDCIIDAALTADFQSAWQNLPRPHVIVSRRASAWTPNKDWPDANWAELITGLAQTCGVIEIGAPDPTAIPITAPHYRDLRGQTPEAHFIAAIAAADIHAGPMSGPVHIAAAAGKPSVIVLGGYEDPANTAYPGNIALYTKVPCAPCWLREPCPYDRKCLTAIAPGIVEQAVRRVWGRDRGD